MHLKIFNHFHSGYWLTSTLANSEDPDEMLHNAAFHQGVFEPYLVADLDNRLFFRDKTQVFS